MRVAAGNRQRGRGDAAARHVDEDRVRVRVFKDVTLGQDVKSLKKFYTRGSVDSMFGEYTVDVKYDLSGKPEFIFKHWDAALEPYTPYTIYISMYRPGVPFYYQKEDFTLAAWRESAYFSKDLPVSFKTTSYDKRNTVLKVFDWWGSTTGEKMNKIYHWFGGGE